MISRAFEQLRRLNDACLHPGAEASIFAEVARDHGIVLPYEHGALLQQSNGAEAYGGYIRLFGMRTTQSVDSVTWNQHDYWKFAWQDRCSGYWCFAETAWGDQYAYPLEPLRIGGTPDVYFLDAFSMTPRLVASSFTEFFEKEFIRSGKEPYDAVTKQAREKVGRLEAGSHVVYVPSLLLGGVEDSNNVQKMNARSAMICNGDIATQLDAGPPNGAVKAVESYEDQLRRMRLRLIWA